MAGELSIEEAVRQIEAEGPKPVPVQAPAESDENIDEAVEFIELGTINGQTLPELASGPSLFSAEEGAETRDPLPGEIPDEPIQETSATKRFLGGAVRDLFGVAEFLADVLPHAPEAGPGPTLTDTAIRPARDAVLETTGLPTEPQGGFVENLGSELGAAAVPVVGTAVRRGRQAVGAARLATEAGAATGAAGGRTRSQESGFGVGGEIGGGLAGGVSGGLGTRGAIGAARGVGQAARVATGAESKAGARARARKTLERNVPSPEARARAIEGIDQTLELQEKIPGFEATLGGATADPHLQALEADLISNPDPKSSVTAFDVERARLESSGAVVNAVRRSGPPAGRGTEAVAVRRAREMVDDRIKAVDDGLEELRGTSSTDEISRARRERLGADYEAWNAEYDVLFDELDDLAARRGVRVPSGPLKRAAANARASVGEFERDLISPLEPILQQIEDLPAVVDFQALRSLRRRINREFRDGTISERPLAALSKGTKAALGQIELPVSANLTPEQKSALRLLRQHNPDANILSDVAERYKQANATFAEGATRYQEGIAGRILSPRSNIGNSQTMDLYFVRGDKGHDAAQQYLNTFGDTAESRSAMVDFITRQAADQAGDSAARLRRFRAAHASALREFPEAAERIRNIELLQNSAEELGVSRATARSPERIQRGAVALFAEDPHLAVRKVLSSPRPEEAMTGLLTTMHGDSQAIEGLRRIFWDVLETEAFTIDPTRSARAADLLSGRPLLTNGPRMRSFVDNNEGAIRILFGDGTPDMLREFSTAAELAGAFPVNVAGKAREQGRSAIEEVGRGGFLTRIGSVEIKAIRSALTLNKVLKRLSGEEADRLLREAVLDLRLGKTLLSEASDDSMRRVQTLMTKRGFTLPARVFVAQEGERGEEE